MHDSHTELSDANLPMRDVKIHFLYLLRVVLQNAKQLGFRESWNTGPVSTR